MADGTHQLTADQAGLLAAVLAQPSRDDLRLIFADTCDDAGDGERAEFIRCQVRLAELGGECLQLSRGNVRCGMVAAFGIAPCEVCALKRRERELLEEHETAWLPEIMSAGRANPRQRKIGWNLGWSRGFVSLLHCSWPACRDHLDSIRREQPVERVVLTSLPSSEFGGLTGRQDRAAIKDRLAARWPGVPGELGAVAFELPPEPTWGNFDGAPYRTVSPDQMREFARRARGFYSNQDATRDFGNLDFDVI